MVLPGTLPRHVERQMENRVFLKSTELDGRDDTAETTKALCLTRLYNRMDSETSVLYV